jgi:hypothetical protein
MDGWTPEDVVTLVVGVVAAVLSVVALIPQGVLWRREGPALRLEIHPAWKAGNGYAVSVRPSGGQEGRSR